MNVVPPATLLDVHDLSLTYAAGVRALNDVSLTVGRGEIVGLVGESGCGKSIARERRIGRPIRTPGRSCWMASTCCRPIVERFGRSASCCRSFRKTPPRRLIPACQSPVRSSSISGRRAGIGPAKGSDLGSARACGPCRPNAARRPHELSGGQNHAWRSRGPSPRNPSSCLRRGGFLSGQERSGADPEFDRRASERDGRGVPVHLSRPRGGGAHLRPSARDVLGLIVESGPALEPDGRSTHPYTQALVSSVPGAGDTDGVGVRSASDYLARPVSGCPYRQVCPLATPECDDFDLVPTVVRPGHEVCACTRTWTPYRRRESTRLGRQIDGGARRVHVTRTHRLSNEKGA